MTDLDKMWAALAAHQSIADKTGYGKEWARMCEERTADAARDATYAADADAAWDAVSAAYAAASAADAADANRRALYADSPTWAAYATDKAADAIHYIEKANKGELQ